MTYLAPRQGLFAIIVFISFCLHSLLLVMNTDQTLHDSRQQKGERMLTYLVNESTIALTNKDRVSLGVIANRYSNDDDVMHLEVLDAKGQVLAQVGDAPLHKGKTITRQITQEKAVIGDINMVMKQTSKGEIFKMLWPFILGSLILHTLLWLAYGFIARPTKAQLTELSRDIHEHYRTYYSTGAGAAASGFNLVDDEDDDIQEDVQDDIVNYINETDNQVSPDDNGNYDTNTFIDNKEESSSINTSGTFASIDTDNENTALENKVDETGVEETEIEDRVFEVNVDIKFADENGMMAMVADDYIAPYLTLCTQLLQQAINEVVNQPNVYGVYLKNNPVFTQNGANVVLKVDSEYSKIGLAGAMLAMLYSTLNQMVFEKNKELGSFALPVKTGISYNKTNIEMQTILENQLTPNEVAVLLPKYLHTQINQNIQLVADNTLSTVQTQNCEFIEAADEQMQTRLNNMRDSVITKNR